MKVKPKDVQLDVKRYKHQSEAQEIISWVAEVFTHDKISTGGSTGLLLLPVDQPSREIPLGSWILVGTTGKMFLCSNDDFHRRYEITDWKE